MNETDKKVEENKNSSSSNKMSDTKRLDNANMRLLLFKKYLIELGTTLLILVTILVLAFSKIIDGCTVGTLLGTIVGYSLKDIRKYQNKD